MIDTRGRCIIEDHSTTRKIGGSTVKIQRPTLQTLEKRVLPPGESFHPVRGLRKFAAKKVEQFTPAHLGGEVMVPQKQREQ